MKSFVTFCISILSLAAPPLLAQAPEGQTPKSQTAAVDAAPLIKALAAMDGKQGFRLVGRVSKKEPEAQEMGGMQMMMPGAMTAGFAGRFEMYRPGRGETVIVSKRQVPGFVVHVLDDRRLTQTTFRDTPQASGQMARDLTALFELRKLTRILQRSKRIKRNDHKDGSITFTASLGPQLIPETGEGGAGGMGMMMAPRVLRVVGTWKLNDKGRIQEMRFEVARNNPMAAMQARAMAAGGQMDGRAMEGMAEDKTPGPIACYALEVQPNKPSKRCASALSRMRKLVDE